MAVIRQHNDWSLHGDEIIKLYISGLSTRELIPIIFQKYNRLYPSGTLNHYLGQKGVLRSKAEAHKLAISKQIRNCETCFKDHTPRSYNQRWCDECTGQGKYTRRIRIHGLPGTVYEKMFLEQSGKCKICEKQFENCLNTKEKKTLYVDHDHTTGQVRGLLCPRCNVGLAFLDDKTWHQKASAYIIEALNNTHDSHTVNPPRINHYVKNARRPIIPEL